MKPTVRRLFPVLYIAALLPLMLPVPAALAGVCPTTTMDQILLLGNCTIGGAHFDFTQPQLSGHPACFNGPFI